MKEESVFFKIKQIKDDQIYLVEIHNEKTDHQIK